MFWLNYLPTIICLVGVFALFLWWVIRRLIDPKWLPILRVLPVPKRQTPSFFFQTPPWLPFICFLLLLVLFLIASLQKEEQITQKETLKNDQIGVVIDLSPSISGGLSIKDYRKLVLKTLKPWLPNTQILLYRSDLHKISEVRTLASLKDGLSSMSFHRFGFQIVDGVKALRQSRPSLRHVVLFSDGERSSWESFQWKFFDKQIKFSNIQTSHSKKANIFIRKVDSRLQLDGSFVKWVIEVASSHPDNHAFKIVMKDENANEIASTSAKMSPDQLSLSVEIPVQREKLTSRVSIYIDSNDSVESDNTFHVHGLRFGKTVGLVSASEGERFIDNSLWHMDKLLETLGFRVLHYSDSSLTQSNLDRSDFWLLRQGARKNQTKECGALSDLLLSKKNQKIWLMPFHSDIHLQSFCKCTASFIDEDYDSSQLPPYCKSFESLSQWSDVLRSMGGIQVGGEISKTSGSIAWNFKLKNNNELLAFSMPLAPGPLQAFDHGQFGLLIKNLLSWQEEDSTFAQKVWPRPLSFDETKKFKTKLLNVPVSESQMSFMNKHDLPSTVKLTQGQNGAGQVIESTNNDATPWVVPLLWGVLVLLTLEVLVMFREGNRS